MAVASVGVAVLRVAVAACDAVFIATELWGAVRVFVVPRANFARSARLVFVLSRRGFHAVARAAGARDAAQRDRFMVNGAPLGLLLLLPGFWLGLVLIGYAGLFSAMSGGGVQRAIVVSGSSLLTLGFASPGSFWPDLVAVAEAGMGVGLLAVVIAYLPSIYAAFSRRELVVAMMDVRAGTPPYAVTFIERHHRNAGLEHLDAASADWERRIVDVGESHASHPVLPFLRSPDPRHSWITAASALLDAANLRISAMQLPGGGNAGAWLFLRAGTSVLMRIATFYAVPLEPEQVSVTRAEFDAAIAALTAAGVAVIDDQELAWERFSARRAGYDRAVLGLAMLVDAPSALWSADRAPPFRHPPMLRRS